MRTAAFHSTQPLFATGADDGLVRVFNYTTHQLLFTLVGHVDYVRQVAFHQEIPWLVSCSDDQTIRIWNWQSRQQIACITGHSHYVMSVAFFAKASQETGSSSADSMTDWLASGSLDQTVRVWDLSSIRKKHASSSNSRSKDDAAIDFFGHPDGQVLMVLEHDRGVNWVAWHPQRSGILLSASDDRTVRLWNTPKLHSTVSLGSTSGGAASFTSVSGACEILKGHSNNVSCVTVPPALPHMLLSAGEDKTVRVYDWPLNPSATSTGRKPVLVGSIKRDKDRWWVVCGHPSKPLVAAGHDSGWAMWKVGRERLPWCFVPDLTSAKNVLGGSLFFYNQEDIWQVDSFAKKLSSISASRAYRCATAAMGSQNHPLKLAFCPEVNRLILSDDPVVPENPSAHKGSPEAGFEPQTLLCPLEPTAKEVLVRGFSPVVLPKGRLALLDGSCPPGAIGLVSLKVVNGSDGSILKTNTLPDEKIVRMFPAQCSQSSSNTVCLVSKDGKVTLWDASKGVAVDSFGLNFVPSGVAWSEDEVWGAFWSKHALAVVKRERSAVSVIGSISDGPFAKHCIKGAAWDEHSIAISGHQSSTMLLIATGAHLHFVLPQLLCNGSQRSDAWGVLMGLSEGKVYPVRVLSPGRLLGLLPNQASCRVVQFEAVEPTFRLALHYNNRRTLNKVIEGGKLVGQAPLNYLHHHIITNLAGDGQKDVGNEGGISVRAALPFVQDPQEKFQWALDAGDMESCREAILELAAQNEENTNHRASTSKKLKIDELWRMLGDAAMVVGKFELAEEALREAQAWLPLATLLFVTGQARKAHDLAESLLLNDAEHSSQDRQGKAREQCDPVEALHCAILAGDGELAGRALALATHSILSQDSSNSPETTRNKPMKLHLTKPKRNLSRPLTEWPSSYKPILDLPSDENQERIDEDREYMRGKQESFVQEETGEQEKEDDAWGDSLEDLALQPEDEVDELEAALLEAQLEDDIHHDKVSDYNSELQEDHVEDPLASIPVLHRKWASSRVPGILARLGREDLVQDALRKQVGLDDIAPLLPLIQAVHSAHHYVDKQGRMQPQDLTIHSKDDDDAEQDELYDPMGPSLYNPQSIQKYLADNAHPAMTAGKWDESLKHYRQALYSCLLATERSQDEEHPSGGTNESIVKDKLIPLCAAYIRAVLVLSGNLRNTELTEAGELNKACLVALSSFLLPEHRILAGRTAVTALFKAKCFKSAGAMARLLLPLLDNSSDAKQQALRTNLSKVIDVCSKTNQSDAIALDPAIIKAFASNQFILEFCPQTLHVFKDSERESFIECTVCLGKFDKSINDGNDSASVCPICLVHKFDGDSRELTGLVLAD